MRTAELITLSTGLTTATIALVGYWINQRQKRRERRSETFAAALEAVREYEQAPYLIRRRESSEPGVRAQLAERLSASAGRRRYYATLLRLDSPVVADAYQALLDQTRRQAGPYRSEAWKSPVITRDEDFPGSANYVYDNGPEWDLCLVAMRREFSFLARAGRRRTRRQVAAIIASRGP
ncbi:hypothetical protein [Spirillospora sp. CA-294931]|uniref:hypothetical protein n=1 Tax=Spirillospora sp. CA-294931 TaxID=3240042 RepID=UPI003D9006B3